MPERPNEGDLAMKRLKAEFRPRQAGFQEVAHLVREPENPGDLSVWGVVNGITSAAKAYAHAENRSRVSNLAGRILTATVR